MANGLLKSSGSHYKSNLNRLKAQHEDTGLQPINAHTKDTWDEGLQPVNPNITQREPTGTTTPSSYPYGYGYTYGNGGGGDTGPTERQMDAALNQGAVSKFNAQTPILKFQNNEDAAKVAEKGARQQMQTTNDSSMFGKNNEWWSNYLLRQQVYQQNAIKAGNTFTGSSVLDRARKTQEEYDAMNASILESVENDQYSSLLEYLSTMQNIVNSLNGQAADTEASLRNIGADYVATLNNIHPGLVNGDYDLEAYRTGKIAGDEDIDYEGDDDTEKLIDIEKNDINLPDWLNWEFYKSHRRDATKPSSLGGIGWVRPLRPTGARQNSAGQQNHHGSSSAANARYWDALTSTYNQRRY